MLANIAEGYGQEYRQEYIQFLRIAQSSLKKLDTYLSPKKSSLPRDAERFPSLKLVPVFEAA